jgi:hypothetical protein
MTDEPPKKRIRIYREDSLYELPADCWEVIMRYCTGYVMDSLLAVCKRTNIIAREYIKRAVIDFGTDPDEDDSEEDIFLYYAEYPKPEDPILARINDHVYELLLKKHSYILDECTTPYQIEKANLVRLSLFKHSIACNSFDYAIRLMNENIKSNRECQIAIDGMIRRCISNGYLDIFSKLEDVGIKCDKKYFVETLNQFKSGNHRVLDFMMKRYDNKGSFDYITAMINRCGHVCFLRDTILEVFKCYSWKIDHSLIDVSRLIIMSDRDILWHILNMTNIKVTLEDLVRSRTLIEQKRCLCGPGETCELLRGANIIKCFEVAFLHSKLEEDALKRILTEAEMNNDWFIFIRLFRSPRSKMYFVIAKYNFDFELWDDVEDIKEILDCRRFIKTPDVFARARTRFSDNQEYQNDIDVIEQRFSNCNQHIL